jgi:hypothetical protein
VPPVTGEAEAIFYASIGFGPFDPSIESANIFDSGNICGKFPPGNLRKASDDLRPSKRLAQKTSWLWTGLMVNLHFAGWRPTN